jgi:DNA-binding CsgD family transcriptional regulator
MYQAIASLVDRSIDERGDRLRQWPWLVVAVDALIGSGRVDAARAELDELASLVEQRTLTSPAAELARLRGGLAEANGDLPQAEEHYRAGVDAPDAMPYARGRVLLAHGRLLRRMGRRRDAVGQLRRARAELAALGATPDVRACDDELAACGEAILTRIDEHASLTPAELSVAHLVAQGLSNREAAAHLYVSPKTVEYHLGHIFAKLHITSRRQLAGAFPGT